jgi:hypothetical protein
LIALIFGALAVGLIAGCGSGGSGDSTSSLTKAEFIKKANAVCTKHHKQIVAEFEALVKKTGVPEGSEAPAALAAFAEAVIFPSIKSEAEEFRAIGTPSGAEAEVEAISASFEKGVKEAEKDPKTGKRPPELEKANKLAEEFGLSEDCVVT